MNKRIKIFIERDYDQVEVYLMQRKEGGWSFINMTKNHICPCIFNTIGEALEDLINQKDVTSFEVVVPHKDTDGFEDCYE